MTQETTGTTSATLAPNIHARRLRRVRGLALVAMIAPALVALALDLYGATVGRRDILIWTLVPWIVAVLNGIAYWRAAYKLRTARALILWSVVGGLAISVIVFGTNLGGMALFLAWTVVLGAMLYGPSMVFIATLISLAVVIITLILELLGIAPLVPLDTNLTRWGNFILAFIYPLAMAGSVYLYADYIQETLLATSKRIEKYVDDLMESAQQQAATSQQQAAAVQEISATAEELSRTAEQLNEHSRQLDEIAGQTFTIVHNGEKVIDDILSTVQKFADDTRKLVQQAIRLNEQSQRIGEIVDMMNRISDETHLIALNAAIEAASAGEHGHRFSVIAAEIRRLSEHAIKSGDQIKAIIRDLQQATQAAVMNMETQMAQVEHMEGEARTAQTYLNEMVGAVDLTRTSAHELSNASEDLHSVSQQLAMSLQEMTQTAEALAHSSHLALEAAKELQQVAQAITRSGV